MVQIRKRPSQLKNLMTGSEIPVNSINLNTMTGAINQHVKKHEGKIILGTIQTNKNDLKKRKRTKAESQLTNYKGKQRDSLDVENLNKFKFYKEQKSPQPKDQDSLFTFMKNLAQRHCERKGYDVGALFPF